MSNTFRRIVPGSTLLVALIVATLLVDLIEQDAGVRFVAAQPADSNSPKPKPTEQGDKVPPEFRQAGVCARCHVVSVLEWGVSAHVAAEADCQSCHGSSREHAANERNEVKPDQLARGSAAVKELCSTCHETGCPKTLEVQSCQTCHHVHALIDPSKPPAAQDDRLTKLVALWGRFKSEMAKGEKHVSRRDWVAAQTAFTAALKLIPGNQRARLQLEMCGRRLDPHLPGFETIGDEIDEKMGLPVEVTVRGLGCRMRLVQAGEFDLGSDDLEDSRPVHTVQVDAFFLGRSEITQAEWRSVMGNNPSAHQGQDFPDVKQMPVERVSWNDCQEFLRRLNQRVPGGGFRLPTEAEWEFACRAGSSQPAQEALPQYGWFRANSLRRQDSDGAFLRIEAYAPKQIGTRRGNAWGLFDMQGNVCEWCSTLWHPYLDTAAANSESLAEGGKRIVRGGGFADSATSLDPALRHAERPHRRLRWNGLRLARDVPALRERAVSQ